MYIVGDDPTSKPFYGYATKGGISAWHYLDGITGELRFQVGGGDFVIEPDGDVQVARDLNASGDINAVESINAGTTMSADEFIYSESQIRYYSVPPAAFVPGNSNQDWVTEGGSGISYLNSNAGGSNLVAPVYLPHGATVTELMIFYVDNTPTSSISIELLERYVFNTFYTSMARAASTDLESSPNANWQSDTSIAEPVIDNSQNAYILSAYSSDWQGALTKIKGARITYTVPSPD